MSSNELGFREMFWQVKANVLEREKQDVKKGKPGLYGLQKGRKKKNWQTNKASVMSKI